MKSNPKPDNLAHYHHHIYMHIMEYALPFCPNLPPPSLPRTHTLSTPAVAWYFPAPQSMHELATVAPVVVEYLPASQLVQTLDPAIYVHTLSQTTLCKFLHLNISRWPYYEHSLSHSYVCMYVCYDNECLIIPLSPSQSMQTEQPVVRAHRDRQQGHLHIHVDMYRYLCVCVCLRARACFHIW